MSEKKKYDFMKVVRCSLVPVLPEGLIIISIRELISTVYNHKLIKANHHIHRRQKIFMFCSRLLVFMMTVIFDCACILRFAEGKPKYASLPNQN